MYMYIIAKIFSKNSIIKVRSFKILACLNGTIIVCTLIVLALHSNLLYTVWKGTIHVFTLGNSNKTHSLHIQLVQPGIFVITMHVAVLRHNYCHVGYINMIAINMLMRLFTHKKIISEHF